jgi:hypothetical protein
MTDHRTNALVYIIELLRRSHLVRYWLPVFIWMAGIFYLSSRSNPSGFLPASEHGINIDRLAHIAEYAGLAALLYRALRKQRNGAIPVHGRWRWEVVFVLALAYAVLDELHQELVPGRGFELVDIGCDLTGIMATLGLIWARETNERVR